MSENAKRRGRPPKEEAPEPEEVVAPKKEKADRVTLNSNLGNPLELPGKCGEIFPGKSLEVDPKEWAGIKDHNFIKMLLSKDLLKES